MGTYTKNADGVNVHYGTRSTEYLARKERSGKITMNLIGENIVTDPSATDALKAEWMRGAVIPSGAVITEAKLYVSEAFTSDGAATLDIGTYNADTGAAVDANGIDAAIALTAIDSAGNVITCDGAQVWGADSKTALTAAAYVSCSWGTAVYTAGAARLELEYIVPQNS